MRKLVAWMLGLLLICGLAMPAAADAPHGAAGVVTDELGRPIFDAEVEVYQLGAGLVAVTATNASGRFVVEKQVTPGSLWQLRVSAKGYRTADTGWIDFGKNSYQSVQLKQMTGALRVAAVDRDGAPAPAQILVIGPDGSVAADLRADDGRAELNQLISGQYRVVVRADGAVAAVRSVAVTPGATAPVLVTVQPAAIAVAGEVRDAVTGAPVPGATVELLRDDQTLLVDGGSTDATGRFRTGLGTGETGAVKVRVTAPGYRAFTTDAAVLTGGHEQDFSADRAVQLSPAFTTISGVVLNTGAGPLKGAGLRLEARGFGWFATATSVDNGAFQFENVPNDPNVQYRVSVTDEDRYVVTDWLTIKRGVTDQIILQAGGGNATTYGEGSLAGSVVDADGLPVAGAKIELYRRNHLQRTFETDARGEFVDNYVTATRGWNMQADPYMLKISKDGFVVTSEVTIAGQSTSDVHVTRELRTTVRATLRPERYTLRGRVIGLDGEAVQNAEVHLVSGANQPVVSSVRTDAAGWYKLTALPATPSANMSVRVKAEGYRPISGVPVALGPEAIISQPPIRMAKGVTALTGQVLDLRGQPVSFADVEVRAPAGGSAAKGKTDENGIYRIEAGLPVTGLVALLVSKDGWSSAADVADLAQAGGTISRDLVIAPTTGMLSGRVGFADGRAAADVWVDLLQEGKGVVATVKTDSDGYYRFDKVAVAGGGWFWLRVRGQGITFAGSLRHGTELVPLLQVPAGQEIVTDLLVK